MKKLCVPNPLPSFLAPEVCLVRRGREGEGESEGSDRRESKGEG